MIESRTRLQPPYRTLLGPGPTNVHPRVLQAMIAPLLSHLDPDFIAIMDEVRQMLRQVVKNQGGLALPVSGTGTAGMEAALVNLLEPGDIAIIAVNGFFGERMVEIASRCGATPVRVDFPWGRPVEPGPIAEALKHQKKVKLVAVVHTETSTGVLNPLPELARLAHHHDALLLVDAVTSLGGCDLDMDAWGIDALYSATQKCIGAPPGLAPVSLGEAASRAIQQRKTKVQTWYLDLSVLEKYWQDGGPRAYHHTAPISMVYGLREALSLVLEEGLEARFARHLRNGRALRAGLEAMGLELLVQGDWWAPQLTTVHIPNGIDDRKVRQRLLQDYSLEIGGGLGAFAGKAWRIGLMGHSSTAANVLTVLSALETILNDEGFEVARGEGVAAAQRELAG